MFIYKPSAAVRHSKQTQYVSPKHIINSKTLHPCSTQSSVHTLYWLLNNWHLSAFWSSVVTLQVALLRDEWCFVQFSHPAFFLTEVRRYWTVHPFFCCRVHGGRPGRVGWGCSGGGQTRSAVGKMHRAELLCWSQWGWKSPLKWSGEFFGLASVPGRVCCLWSKHPS